MSVCHSFDPKAPMVLDGPPLIIAEVAQTHDGSLGQAHAFIDAIARTGAHGVKFQTHIAAAESTPAEPWRVKFSRQDASRYDYWKRMEFTPEQWQGLRNHAVERGLYFLSSPFSVEAVELLTKVGVSAWKVASGEVTNPILFQCMAQARLPFLLSTGMSSWQEIDAGVERIRSADCTLALFQCTSRYPTPPEKVGLNVLAALRTRYNCPVGLSDHSGTIAAGIAAVALGAGLLEVHVTFSREMFGPDVPVSLTMPELAQLVSAVAFVDLASRNPVDKDREAQELSSMRSLFTKSVALRHPLPAGARLTAGDLTTKKPGTGIPADALDSVVGRTLTRDHLATAPLDWDDLV